MRTCKTNSPSMEDRVVNVAARFTKRTGYGRPGRVLVVCLVSRSRLPSCVLTKELLSVRRRAGGPVNRSRHPFSLTWVATGHTCLQNELAFDGRPRGYRRGLVCKPPADIFIQLSKIPRAEHPRDAEGHACSRSRVWHGLGQAVAEGDGKTGGRTRDLTPSRRRCYPKNIEQTVNAFHAPGRNFAANLFPNW